MKGHALACSRSGTWQWNLKWDLKELSAWGLKQCLVARREIKWEQGGRGGQICRAGQGRLHGGGNTRASFERQGWVFRETRGRRKGHSWHRGQHRQRHAGVKWHSPRGKPSMPCQPGVQSERWQSSERGAWEGEQGCSCGPQGPQRACLLFCRFWEPLKV